MAELLPVQYEPLDPELDYFRVIVTIPGLEEHMIDCEMWCTSIKDEEHICLSYTWLPSTPPHDVMINGRIATVEEYLWHFLRAAGGLPLLKSTCGISCEQRVQTA